MQRYELELRRVSYATERYCSYLKFQELICRIFKLQDLEWSVFLAQNSELQKNLE